MFREITERLTKGERLKGSAWLFSSTTAFAARAQKLEKELIAQGAQFEDLEEQEMQSPSSQEEGEESSDNDVLLVQSCAPHIDAGLGGWGVEDSDVESVAAPPPVRSGSRSRTAIKPDSRKRKKGTQVNRRGDAACMI